MILALLFSWMLKINQRQFISFSKWIIFLYFDNWWMREKSQNKYQCHISRNWQYTDVYRKMMKNQHHSWILDAIYYLNFRNVHLKLAFCTEWNILFSLIPFCHCTINLEKPAIFNFLLQNWIELDFCVSTSWYLRRCPQQLFLRCWGKGSWKWSKKFRVLSLILPKCQTNFSPIN